MYLANDRCDRVTRLLFAVALVWAWTGAPLRAGQAVPASPAPAGAGAGDPGAGNAEPTVADLQTMTGKMEAGYQRLEESVRAMPRDGFDPRALAEKLGKDPVALFAFVRDQTYYLPYRGSLRGPVGVLMERAGNSLDRALLLAELLRHAGHEVRLARAQLSAERIAELAAKIKPPPPEWPLAAVVNPPPDAKPDAAPLPEAAASTQKLIVKSQKMAEDAAAGIERDLALVRGALALVELPARAALPPAVDSDHWWVQHKAGDAWVSLDPLLPDARPGEAVIAGPAEAIAFDPKTRRPVTKEPVRHEVELRVVIEQLKDNKLATKTPLTHVLVPADLAGRHVTLKFAPLGWKDDQLALEKADWAKEFSKAVAVHREWRPILLLPDEQHASNLSFDITGEMSARAGSNPLDSAMTRGLSALQGIGAPAGGADKSVLSAVWIEYEIRVPGQAPQITRRTLFDLLDPAARAAGTAPAGLDVDDAAATRRGLSLAGEIDVLAQSGRMSINYLTHLWASSMLHSKARLLEMLRSADSESPTKVARRGVALRPGVNALHLLAVARHALNRGGDVYQDRPNVLTYVQRPRFATDDALVAERLIDIVENGVRARPGVADPFAAAMRQGVTDTVAEAVVLVHAARSDILPRNVSIAAGLAPAQNVTWSAMTAGNNGLPQSKLPPTARPRARAELAAGAVLVAPSAPVAIDGVPFVGWYRIDPATGQTLGVSGSGEGISLVEGIALIGLGGVVGIISTLSCTGIKGGVSNTKLALCLGCGLATTFFIVAAGLALMGTGGAVAAFVGSGPGWVAASGITGACGLVGFGMD